MLSVMSPQTRVTLDEFLATPEIDERRLELIDGEVCEKVSPRWVHGNLAGELYALFRGHGFASVEPRAIIPGSGNLADSAPIADFAFFRDSRPELFDWARTPPDLVAEVLSPGQNRRDMRAKIDLYLAFGVRSVWIFDIGRRVVDVYEGGARTTLGDGDTLTPMAMPAVAIDLKALFDSVGA
jgi:Uma2 family endonuclease